MSSPLAVAAFLHGRLRHLHGLGFDVSVLAPREPNAETLVRSENATFHPVALVREIRPWTDAAALWRLWRWMRRERPSICHVGTPKAGLLGGLAAWLAGVPCRVYTLYGLRFETARGARRALLWCAEWISCHVAQRVVCVGGDLRCRAVQSGAAPALRTIVVAPGSPNGIDAGRFAASPSTRRRAAHIREQLGIPQDAPVIGFMGRLTRDKGLPELVDAFGHLRNAYPGLRLLLVGPWENDGDPVPARTREMINKSPHIVTLGPVGDPAPYYHVFDVLALPTHREGFPTVVIEAGAAGKPVVAARATGLVDAVADGITGLLTPVGDAGALARALASLLDDPEWARRLGNAGRVHSLRYQPEALWKGIAALYEELLANHPSLMERARRSPGEAMAAAAPSRRENG